MSIVKLGKTTDAKSERPSSTLRLRLREWHNLLPTGIQKDGFLIREIGLELGQKVEYEDCLLHVTLRLEGWKVMWNAEIDALIWFHPDAAPATATAYKEYLEYKIFDDL